MAQSSVDVVVVGAGISGIAAAKCLKEAGLSVTVIEGSGDVGGLWTFKEKGGYGVMRFTHINVSKQNYSFSDFPFPDDVPDYPHNKHMAAYVKRYVEHFEINKLIKFHTQVTSIERDGDGWKVVTQKSTTENGGDGDGQQEVIKCKFVAIASGHHAKPSQPKFEGQDDFKGEIIHSVSFKDAITNEMVNKRVVIVGIGNSAIDAAVNLATEGRCCPVYLSTRSGAWVVPNYVFGHPTDHYACRLFLNLPWRFATTILEGVISLVSGSPYRWGFNPKMHALQTQPTVSPTLINHVQRGQVKIMPNIKKFEGNKVVFTDGQSVEADHVIMCTGYHIDLPFLSPDIREQVLDPQTNTIRLFKNVFSPEIGHTLGFIGFVQPASGGVLTMSETQSRWFAQLCKNNIKLPQKDVMKKDIEGRLAASKNRYYSSARHTIQEDPILYNDTIASYFGAKPQVWKHPSLAWHLLLSSCGAAQWRIQGPHKWSGAIKEVKKVPVTEFLHYSVLATLIILGVVVLFFGALLCNCLC